MTDKINRQIFEDFNPKRLFFNYPMSKLISFRVGGPADVLFLPASVAELEKAIEVCRTEAIPYQVLGRGSNVLVSDRGIRGMTIYLKANFTSLSINQDTISAQAGASLASLAALAARHSLSGLEFAAGIPGSLGGAVLMNASAYDGQMADLVVSSSYLTREGQVKNRLGQDHDFAYRHSAYSDSQDLILTAELKLQPADRQTIYQKMNDFQVRRRTSQPLDKASAGSAFKRPPGNYASKLIADSGLKGYRYHQAGVSSKHAGFIINYGGAKAADINQVFAHVKTEVKRQFGVSLEPEVRWLGEWLDEEVAWKLS